MEESFIFFFSFFLWRIVHRQNKAPVCVCVCACVCKGEWERRNLFYIGIFQVKLFECWLFVTASHQLKLDTRSMTRRSIIVEVEGRGGAGSSRDSNPAGLYWSSVPTGRWPSRSREPFGLDSVLDFEHSAGPKSVCVKKEKSSKVHGVIK